MPVQLSIFIICKNEAHIIAETLAQAQKLADEIVVVDSGSTDETLAICRSYTNQVIEQDWLGYGAQKNFALDLCHGQWCLNLDADEVLSDELIAEIKAKLNSDSNVIAYKLPRELYIADKFIRYAGYFPDAQLRLFRNGLARFNQRQVHESLELDLDATCERDLSKAMIETLKYPLRHYAYRSFDEMQEHFMRYAKLGRQYVTKSNLVLAWLKAIYSFFYKFIVRLGFLHGWLGFRLACLHAKYSFMKYAPGPV